MFAAFGVWAGITDGWIPGVVLGAVSALIIASMMRDCAAAAGTWLSTIDGLADGREVFSMAGTSVNGASPGRRHRSTSPVTSASGENGDGLNAPTRDIQTPARGIGMTSPSPRLARESRVHMSERED